MNNYYEFQFNTRNIDLFYESLAEYDDQKLIVGEYPNDFTLNVTKSQGRYENHIMRLQDVFNFIISKSAYRKILENELTGWKSYPITVDSKTSELYGFSVTGRCGPMITRNSGFVIGYEIDENTLDGSDFFIPQGTLSIVCTEKAKNVLESLSIKNIIVPHISETEWYKA
ncbi:MAG: hypothetical protein OCC49_19875 [Fibrobacterales bacterium]